MLIDYIYSQLTLRGISRLHTQLKLKSKVKNFENKPLYGYVDENVSGDNKIDQKRTRDRQTTSF